MNHKALSAPTADPLRRGPGRPRILPTVTLPEPQPDTDRALCFRASMGIPDAAIYIGVSTWTIENLIRNGELVPVKFGDRTVIVRTDLEGLVERHRKTI